MAMAFPVGIECWRRPLEKLADWVPVDFLLARVKKESDGRPHVQVHRDEKDYLKLSDAEFEFLGLWV